MNRSEAPRTVSSYASANRQNAKQPNVLLIISDDQAWTDYGFMNHPVIRTPRLDQLARESYTFTRGYVPTSLCRPSLMTMITGLYPRQHGITGNDPGTPDDADRRGFRGTPEYRQLREKMASRIDRLPTLPKLLAQKGYLSFQSGKWWEGNYKRGGFTHGMTHGDPQRGGRHGDIGLKIGREGLDPIREFLDQADDQPFLIWYAPFLPHSPHNPPDRLLDKYRDKTPHLALAKYYAMCEWFDETCGELLDELEKRKIAQDTIVIYVTDNGWIQRTPETEVPEGWHTGFAPQSKQSPYDGGLRTPIMIKWPGKIEPKLDTETLASSIDLMPTILAATDAPTPDDLPGRNLLPHCTGAEKLKRQTLFGEIYAHEVADLDDPSASLLFEWCIDGYDKMIQSHPGKLGPYRTIHSVTPRGKYYFDLKQDPHERQLLKEGSAKLEELLETWRSSFGK